jgi:hypothetical protein
MLTAKCTINKVSEKKFSEDVINAFIDATQFKLIFLCKHLKNKPRMRTSVCLKKHFVFTDRYPECSKCPTMETFRESLLMFERSIM